MWMLIDLRVFSTIDVIELSPNCVTVQKLLLKYKDFGKWILMVSYQKNKKNKKTNMIVITDNLFITCCFDSCID